MEGHEQAVDRAVEQLMKVVAGEIGVALDIVERTWLEMMMRQVCEELVEYVSTEQWEQ